MNQPRSPDDTRLASPWKRRHSTAIQDRGHDAYRAEAKHPDPTVCPDCNAVFRAGRWQWGPRPDGAASATCPACRRIQDGFPAGYLEIGGTFWTNHREEVENLIRNRTEAEGREHPLHRLAGWEETDGELHITTTDTHLPRRIGAALNDAYAGKLEIDYADDDTVVHVRWTR